jgi:carbamoylphosphate synthase large subunit
LIASTSWWAFPSRLAMAFDAAGFRVEAICPAHHPLLKTRAVAHAYRYRALAPLAALENAVRRARPSLIVPCDDRSASHLHELHARSDTAESAALIERSLGYPDGFDTAEQRCKVIDLAREIGVRAPEMVAVRAPEDLYAALVRVGLPAVVKVDGTWGGHGVFVVHTADEALRVFQRLQRPLSGASAIKRLLVDRDPYSLRPWLRGDRPLVNVQRFVAGRPANSAVFCWEGEVLASIAVEVLSSRSALSASTVVRVVDNREMIDTSTKLVRRLRLSGFCGFDFMIENGTGAAHLIEMNTRSTPISHLALGPGRDLVAAGATRLLGTAVPPAPVTANDMIAFFPQAWQHDPQSTLLRDAYHDVPWEEPDLIRELVKPPWPDRGWAARLSARLRVGAVAMGRASALVQDGMPFGMSRAPRPRFDRSRLPPG